MRYDKYDPVSGGFRAPLAANYTGVETAIGVGLDANGRVVPGAGVTGVIAVLISTRTRKALDYVDCMTAGEIVEFGGNSGTVYTANTTTGAITTGAASATQTPVGFAVEDDRLVVRVNTPVFIGT